MLNSHTKPTISRMGRTGILRVHVNEASVVFQTAQPAKGLHISQSQSTIVAAKLAAMDAVISLYHAHQGTSGNDYRPKLNL